MFTISSVHQIQKRMFEDWPETRANAFQHNILIHFVICFGNVQTNKQANIQPFVHFISIIILQQLNKFWPYDIFFASTWIPFIWMPLLLYFPSSIFVGINAYRHRQWAGFFLSILFMCMCVYVIFMCTDVFLSLFRSDSIHINFGTINSILYLLLLLTLVSSVTNAPIVAGYSTSLGNISNEMKCSIETTGGRKKIAVLYISNSKNEHFHFLWIKMKFNFQTFFSKSSTNQLYWMVT